MNRISLKKSEFQSIFFSLLIKYNHFGGIYKYNCRQFKLKAQLERRKDDGKWKLLARKVASAKAMTSLSQTQAKRKRYLETPRHSSDGLDGLYPIRTRRQSFLRMGLGA